IEAVENLLDRPSFDETDERPRLRRALEMAVEGLERHFKGRIARATVEYAEYDRAERRLPVLVEAVWPENGAFELEEALASEVFGPILLRTWISMPVTLVRDTGKPEPGAIGRLYPQTP